LNVQMNLSIVQRSLCAAALVCGVATVASADQRPRESDGKDRSRVAESRQRDDDRDSYFHRRGYTRLDIPKGHYPPPGKCRVWFPDRPAGHQPPPGKCDGARVPRGAWLIRHPHDNRDHVHVVAYDDQVPGRILAIGEFRIGSGVFVRVVVDR
jgi:hypothetical protein